MTYAHRLRAVYQANSTNKNCKLWLSFLPAGITALLAAAAGIAHAQSGTPDLTFGTNGRVTTNFATAFDEAFGVAIQPDGKIVAVGSSNAPVANGDLNFAVVRYNPDGSLDTTFGLPGVLTNFRTDVPTDDPAEPTRRSADGARALAIQADGKIVVAGFSDAPNGDSNFALVRYNSDGGVDTTFGDNSIFPGTTLLDFRDGFIDEARAIALQPDGKIVVAGFSTAPTGVDGNFALVRYNANGTLDTTFGDNSIFPGTVLTDFGNGSFDGANAVAVLPDGQIVVAGTSDANGSQDFGLVRYSAASVPDTNFGINNRVLTNFRQLPDGDLSRDLVTAIAVQADGRIVVAGKSNAPNDDFNFAVARYLSAGTAPDGTSLAGALDLTFAASTLNPGISLSDFDNRALGDGTVERSHDEANAIAIQTDGRVVAAGWSDAPLGVGNTNFALVRYGLNGVAITDFGTNNRVLTDFGGSTDRANAIAIQPDGLIVVAGGSDSPVANGNFNFALVRYLP